MSAQLNCSGMSCDDKLKNNCPLLDGTKCGEGKVEF